MNRPVKMTVIRKAVQAAFLFFILFKSYQHLSGTSGKFPSVDGLCPLGALETLGRLFTSGRYLQKLAPSNIIIGLGVFGAALVVGAVFCGWICPFGTLGDWLTALRRKIGIRELSVPAGADKVLRYLRFIVLIVVLYLTYQGGKLIFAQYDPYRTIFGLHWISDPSELAVAGVAIALVTVIAMFFIPRAWCRYACPLGGVLGLLGRIRILGIRRNAEACINCGLCDRACPMGLTVATVSKPGGQCTGCMDCVEKCPKAGALAVAAPRMKTIRSGWLPAFGVGILVVAIATSMGLGFWVTSQRQIISQQVQRGSMSARDIKGWMTFEEVSNLFGIPVETLLEAFNSVGGLTPQTQMREMEKLGGGLETEDVRDFVERYLKEQSGLPVIDETTPDGEATTDGGGGAASQPGTTTTAPKTASNPVGSQGVGQGTGASQGTGQGTGQGNAEGTATSGGGQGNPGVEIKGNMSLSYICKTYGIDLAKLIRAMDLPDDVDTLAPANQLKTVYGFEMSKLRELVEEMRTR